MFQSFFDSIRYVGHLLPLSLLRIFVGYFYLQQFLLDWKKHIIQNTNVSEVIIDALTSDRIPYWYRYFLNEQVIPHWEIYAFLFIGLQLLVAISFLLGYMVRPLSLVAIFLCAIYMTISQNQYELFFKLLIACQVVFLWLGAGRCLGFDYYFYKRYRGLWW
jgi:thiosulfate dehydrogenase (quinone) large subunit